MKYNFDTIIPIIMMSPKGVIFGVTLYNFFPTYELSTNKLIEILAAIQCFSCQQIL